MVLLALVAADDQHVVLPPIHAVHVLAVQRHLEHATQLVQQHAQLRWRERVGDEHELVEFSVEEAGGLQLVADKGGALEHTLQDCPGDDTLHHLLVQLSIHGVLIQVPQHHLSVCTSQELILVHRLGLVIVTIQIETSDLVLSTSLGRNHDNWEIRVVVTSADFQHLVATHSGHHHIKQDDVGARIRRQEIQSLESVHGLVHSPPLRLEQR
mmetsp:Transcript_72674/g.193876  ORF Transcript_72674/g.193876 Transcript_72674/m.193876 type:complete len:211 (+) Transcript_72674:1426-2058(+)